MVQGKLNSIKSVDTVMLTFFLILLGLGVTMLLSASFVKAEYSLKNPYFFFSNQLTNLAIGVLLGTLVYLVPYKTWIRFAWPIGALSIIVLAAMLIPGVAKGKGAGRWLVAIPFQPSEAVKLAVVIVLARYFSHYGILIKKFNYGLVGPFLLLLVYGALIVLQTDLGGAIVVAIIVALMMIAGGVKIWQMSILSFLGVAVYKLIEVFEYRIQRITAWKNPWQDPSDSGYNIIHSFYAFANGGLTGTGPGQSQQKMFFLPENYTDYIFSIIGEEHGLIGVTIISFFFLAFGFRGFMIARSAKSLSGFYLALGMTLCVLVPAFVNMSVALSIIPSKGLPLPFFSYGGSSLIVTCVAIGIIMAVHAESARDVAGNEYLKMAQTRAQTVTAGAVKK
ncbi:MAG: putative lipid II flippase FtsW [Deltaproteobacteria bacterium]|jgi:cell division protein FtsW|nr:putative lipid II flippase FtsW [Deltaproteobacteria bacterium]